MVAALAGAGEALAALSLLLLVAPEALVLAQRGPLLAAPLLGGAALAMAELCFWSLDARGPGDIPGRLGGMLALRLLGACVGGSGLGLLVLAATTRPALGGVGITLLGTAAGVAILGLAAWLLRGALGGRASPG